MSERLKSVGLDVGTTSTQMVLSELTIENRATGFAVPEMEITERRILYRSPVYFTPLLEGNLVDGDGIRRIVTEEYAAAGLTRDAVDTGAIIITGETSRKENARRVLSALADFAGDFVVATAGPHLESVLAAKGAGAVAYSAQTGKTVVHMDIGGGTSNLALIREGEVVRTGCLNVGGRLLKLDSGGRITYCSPVLRPLCSFQPGDSPTEAELEALAGKLVQALEMAVSLRPAGELLSQLWTEESGPVWELPEAGAVLSFSGGVADCIEQGHPWQEFGDIGPILGKTIGKSLLCRGEYMLGSETIRATVIGAGSHSTQLSGSTVFYQNIQFPLKNLPVVTSLETTEQEGPAVLGLKGTPSPGYPQIRSLAETLISQTKGPLLLCLEQDMAKALGQALALRAPAGTPILCIDRIRAEAGSYLDIGAPVGDAMPVVVKTLVLGR